LHDPSDLGLRSHTQVTWVRHPFPTPFFLGLEEDVRPKLIIIIIIITTTIIIINFTLKIKYMLFFIVIIFILILIILMNLIIFIILIIRFNLFGQILIFLNLIKKNYGFSSIVIIIF